MSLLLDALRRAAASKQAPEDEQFVVPRRDDALLEPEQEMPEVPLLSPDPDNGDAAAFDLDAGPDASGHDAAAETDLSLEPETDADRPAAADEAAVDGPEPAAAPRYVAQSATAALLPSRPRVRRQWRGALPAVTLVVVIVAALAFGGWWYYLESRHSVEQGLAAFRPVAEPLVELSPGAEPAVTAVGDGSAAAGAAAAEPEPATVTPEPAGAPAGEPTPGAEPPQVAAAPARDTAGAPAVEVQTAAPAPAARETEATEPAPRVEPVRAEPRPEPRAAQPLVQSTSGPSRLSQALQSGYAALRAGDLDTAAREYDDAIARAPDNRDALLGLATIAQRRGEPERAANHYRRVLADHPRDPTARAGLASLAAGLEPRRSETELKRLLSEQPDSPALQLALGNLYAAESRWSEAQRAFFEAYRAEPGNPEYAYNLAVALDHLGQRETALAHYRRALATAGTGAVSFSLEAVRRRIAQLQ